MTPEEWDEDTPAAENCKQVAESFRDFILTHTNKANEECMAAIGAGMIIFMTRVNAHLDGVTDRTAFDFLNKVTTYSMMTESNWGEACDEILGSA